jgi:transposase InsO family protein
MDFVTGLPESDGCSNLMVVTDRMSKDVVLVALPNIETETVVWAFIKHVVAYHWLPDAIVSDRGSQFLSGLWKRLCEVLGITRRLSTAFHPPTDGATERMNSTVEAYLRAYVDWDQKNWARLLGMAMIAIRGREATSTKVSPFFLQHGYHVSTKEQSGVHGG